LKSFAISNAVAGAALADISLSGGKRPIFGGKWLQPGPTRL